MKGLDLRAVAACQRVGRLHTVNSYLYSVWKAGAMADGFLTARAHEEKR